MKLFLDIFYVFDIVTGNPPCGAEAETAGYRTYIRIWPSNRESTCFLTIILSRC